MSALWRRTRPHPRVGLVLGAGGALGAAWMTGALAALQDTLPRPLGEADVIAGTSAGSVLAAALRCGFSVGEMIEHQRGTTSGPLSVIGAAELGGGALPPRPQMRFGSPRLMKAALRSPYRVHPWVAASACLPRGRGDHAALRQMVEIFVAHARQRGATGIWPRRAIPWIADWAADGRTWIVAVDYDTGNRVAFGRPGAPPAALPDAVVASCSVPGWYRPAIIDGRRYVDGGVRSATSAALLARETLDEVYVLAPMASFVLDEPHGLAVRLERRLRKAVTARLAREVEALRSAGTRVTVLTPGPDDLAVMGANLMDPGRRSQVLETSLRTSAEALASARAPQPLAA